MWEIWIYFDSFMCEYPVFPTPLGEEAVFCPMYTFDFFFCQTLGSYNYMGSVPGSSILFHPSLFVFFPEPCCFLVLTVWLCCIIEIRCFNSLVLLFQTRIVLVIYDLLCFHVNFRFFFPFLWRLIWNFDGDC